MSSFFDLVEKAAMELRDDVAEVVVPTIEHFGGLMHIGGPEVDYENIKNQAQEYYKNLPASALEDGDLLTPDLIKKYGYPSETHLVITDDGYILALHRIPTGKKAPTIPLPKRLPVLLVHGLMSSSADWIIPGPDQALGYILADNGYDVWLGNCRGNTYSRNHINLRTEDSIFWDFSFHEIATLDVAAMIDYVLKETKEERLYYIGHSQGTTVSYTLCAERPEYNKKIKVSCCLAPIGFMDHMVSPVMRMVEHMVPELEIFTASFGAKEFAPSSAIMREAGKFIGTTGGPADVLLCNALFVTCGFSPDQVNPEIVPSLMGHDPAGDSTKQMIHYAQEMRSARFCKYDYEAVDNIKKYGQSSPPDYRLDNITCPHLLFYSNNDWISHPIDVNRFYDGLTNCPKKEKILVGDGKLNHTDYLYAKEAPQLIYSQILAKLKQF